MYTSLSIHPLIILFHPTPSIIEDSYHTSMDYTTGAHDWAALLDHQKKVLENAEKRKGQKATNKQTRQQLLELFSASVSVESKFQHDLLKS